MQRFNSAVEKSLSDPDVSVEDISAQLCMSRAQLYRKVKAITGKSPMEIIRQLRLSKADRLLSETSMNISEIAYSVGFSSASYFSIIFSQALTRYPENQNEISGLMIMGLFGGTVFPLLMGFASDLIGILGAVLVMAVGAAYLLFFTSKISK